MQVSTSENLVDLRGCGIAVLNQQVIVDHPEVHRDRIRALGDVFDIKAHPAFATAANSLHDLGEAG